MPQSQYQKQYYVDNKEKIVNRSVQWQQENREAHNQAVASYARRNPLVGKEASKRYVEKHKGTLPYVQRLMLNRARQRSKKEGHAFNLTLDYITSIWPANNKCPVYGYDFDLLGQDLQRCASLDKIDPTLGYVQGNVIIMSFRANSLKKDSTLSELRVLVEFLERITS